MHAIHVQCSVNRSRGVCRPYLDAVEDDDADAHPGVEAVEVRDRALVVVPESGVDADDPEDESDGMEDEMDELLRLFLQRQRLVTYDSCTVDENAHAILMH